MRKLLRRLPLRLLLILLLVNAALLLLWSEGLLLLNHPRHPVRGVDVSHFQGEIDWPSLAEQNVRFAFIKATEGNGSRDECFEANWLGARRAGLRAGAYHFFSFDNPGETQAANFIETVPVTADALPPAIDVERYGEYRRLPVSDAVVPELRALVDALRSAYGRRPVIYCNRSTYRTCIAGRFDDCDIWFRDTVEIPSLPDGREWTFWQYTDKGRLSGISGEERFIDLNVFHGSQAEFDAYGRADKPGA